jgi:hypothetical protein
VESQAGIVAGGTVRIYSAAVDNAEADVNTFSAGFVAVGGQSATADADGKSTATLGSDAGVSAGALQVEAAEGAEAKTLSRATAGGIVSGVGSSASSDASPDVTADILHHAHVATTGNVDVIAVVTGGANGEADGTNGALFGEIGESTASVGGSPTVDAAVGAGSVVKAGGAVTVEAASPDSKSVSNGGFNAATGVNLKTNTVDFGSPTFATTGDQVVYETNGGAAIGGLQDGRTYSVIRVGPSSLALGQQLGGAQMDFATGAIQFAAPDGFKTGDRVVYSANGGPAIGGLVSGATYYVRVIDATTIKLARTLGEAEQSGKPFSAAAISNDGVITLSGNGFSDGEAVTYRVRGTPVAGLVNGDTYYVIRLNANQFELSALPGGPALALKPSTALGVQTLGDEGVAIDGLGVSGPQSLIFDLTSAGSGEQRFVGVGGAAAALPALNSTPVYQATADGSGGAGFLGLQSASADDTIFGQTTGYVGTGAGPEGRADRRRDALAAGAVHRVARHPGR